MLSIYTRVAVLMLVVFVCRSIHGQAPVPLWMTNVGARVFAVDSQTNVFAETAGKVIQINAAGVPVLTNQLSPYPGMPYRDSSGSFYYAGKYPGSFLPNGATYTNPACFVVKYDSVGSLVWSNNSGPTGFLRSISIRDIQIDPAGNCLVTFTYNVSTTDHSDLAFEFDTTGSNVWSTTLPKSQSITTIGSAQLGPLSPSNAYALTFATFSPSFATLSRLDSTGAATIITNFTALNGGAWLTERPIPNSVGEFYEVEGSDLVKRSASSGDLIWSRNIASTRWTVGRDVWDGVHTGDDNGSLSRYDYDGNEVWSTNLASVCNGMVLDSSGNRFISLTSRVLKNPRF